MEKMKQKRNLRIDIMKGLAIYCVVAQHVSESVLLKEFFSIFHMQTFFLLSGYLSQYSAKKEVSYKKMLFSKGKRLLIPYLVWSSVSLLSNLAMAIVQNKELSLQQMQKEFVNIFLYARSVWFLIVLFILFLIWGFVQVCKNRYKLGGGVKYLLYLFSWFLICVCVPERYFQLFKLKYFYPFFLLGIYLSEYPEQFIMLKNQIPNCIRRMILLFPLLIFCFRHSKAISLFYYFEAEKLYFLEIILGIIFTILGVLFLFYLTEIIYKFKNLRQSAATIGKYSLDIYILHMFFVKFFFYIPVFLNTYIIKEIYNLFYSGIVIIILVLGSKFIGDRLILYRISTGKY